MGISRGSGIAALALLATAAQADDGYARRAGADDGYVRRTNGDIMFGNYPRGSLERGEQGAVGIKVKLDRKGRLTSCEVTESSGYAALDTASCDMLIANARMKPFRSADGSRSVERETTGRIIWALPPDRLARLAGRSAAPTTADKMQLARAGEKVICKTTAEIGTLVRRKKTCLTVAEWRRQYLQAQADTQDMKPKFLPGD